MQKPVRVLRDHEPLAEPRRSNLEGALRAALLMLPEAFSDFQLFAAVAGLSYRGDFRMTFGAEHPRKVTNLVEGNLPHFHALYNPGVLSALPSLAATGTDRTRCVGGVDSIGWLVDPIGLDLKPLVRLWTHPAAPKKKIHPGHAPLHARGAH